MNNILNIGLHCDGIADLNEIGAFEGGLGTIYRQPQLQLRLHIAESIARARDPKAYFVIGAARNDSLGGDAGAYIGAEAIDLLLGKAKLQEGSDLILVLSRLGKNAVYREVCAAAAVMLQWIPLRVELAQVIEFRRVVPTAHRYLVVVV